MRARAPEWRSLARLCRAAVAAAVLAFLVPHGADADLVGHVEERTAVAGRSNDALIEANPLLQRLQRNCRWLRQLPLIHRPDPSNNHPRSP